MDWYKIYYEEQWFEDDIFKYKIQGRLGFHFGGPLMEA